MDVVTTTGLHFSIKILQPPLAHILLMLSKKTPRVQKRTECFRNHDWLYHPWPFLCIGDDAKKVAKGDKVNHGWENKSSFPVNCRAPLKLKFLIHVNG